MFLSTLHVNAATLEYQQLSTSLGISKLVVSNNILIAPPLLGIGVAFLKST